MSNPLLESTESQIPRPESPKTLFISPVSNYSNKEEILENIDNFFEDESKYLDLDSKIYVGKKPEGPKLDKNNNLIYYSYVGNPLNYQKLKGGKILNKRTSNLRNLTENNITNSKKKDIFQLIDYSTLKSYYDDVELRTRRNKRYENDLLYENVPTPIKKILLNQQKNLEEKVKDDNDITKMENFIIKKTNKKREDLLLKNYDTYQIKRGFLRNLEDKEPTELKMGDNNWYFNLRRPKNFKGIRDAYINIRTNDNPFWGRFFETCPKNILRYRKPNIYSLDFITNLENNPYLPKIPNGNSTIDELKNMNNLEIKGKNLLKLEKNLDLHVPGKKKFYNRDQLESHESCKDMSQPEYEKYLQLLNEDKVYADDFDKRDFMKYKSESFSPEKYYSNSLISSSRF